MEIFLHFGLADIPHRPEELGRVLEQESNPLRRGAKCQLETFNRAGVTETLD